MYWLPNLIFTIDSEFKVIHTQNANIWEMVKDTVKITVAITVLVVWWLHTRLLVRTKISSQNLSGQKTFSGQKLSDQKLFDQKLPF